MTLAFAICADLKALLIANVVMVAPLMQCTKNKHLINTIRGYPTEYNSKESISRKITLIFVTLLYQIKISK